MRAGAQTSYDTTSRDDSTHDKTLPHLLYTSSQPAIDAIATSKSHSTAYLKVQEGVRGR